MTKVPTELRYAKTHEWIREEDDGTLTIGITDHAQELLGDLVFIDLPKPGRTVEPEEELAVIESVKAAADIYSPATGRITEVNDALDESPELVNSDPYGAGWILRLRPSAPLPAGALLDAAGYAKLAEEESE
uniref:Glycine cleavage system H protein n=1 Tax=Candidatus Kentrum sp. DK TaxID=2126562 RepID=A0A450STI3_9GAMM|nr:MAG: glycine cleavage system H protein [Candidatus Kentron sp. DK]VFJ57343.1 MAG: glycine cleavage system H protein [Candidatus Kentron sp. DK]